MSNHNDSDETLCVTIEMKATDQFCGSHNLFRGIKHAAHETSTNTLKYLNSENNDVDNN